jgi:hypothetical protein
MSKYNTNEHNINALKECIYFIHITGIYNFYSKYTPSEKICPIIKKLFIIIWVLKSALMQCADQHKIDAKCA